MTDHLSDHNQNGVPESSVEEVSGSRQNPPGVPAPENSEYAALILENQRRYQERRALYLQHGYDIEHERALVLDQARPIAGRILEIGTGKGHLTVALAKHGVPFTSIDLSAEEQRFAQYNLQFHRLAHLVKLEQADAEALPYSDGCFDLVISSNVVHHFVNPRLAVEEALRVLAAEGRIVIGDFNANGLQVIGNIHQREGGHHHVGPGSLRQIRDWFVAAGLQVWEYSHPMEDLLVGKRR